MFAFIRMTSASNPSSLKKPFLTARPAGKKLMLKLVTDKRILSAASDSPEPAAAMITSTTIIKNERQVTRAYCCKEQRAKSKAKKKFCIVPFALGSLLFGRRAWLFALSALQGSAKKNILGFSSAGCG